MQLKPRHLASDVKSPSETQKHSPTFLSYQHKIGVAVVITCVSNEWWYELETTLRPGVSSQDLLRNKVEFSPFSWQSLRCAQEHVCPYPASPPILPVHLADGPCDAFSLPHPTSVHSPSLLDNRAYPLFPHNYVIFPPP